MGMDKRSKKQSKDQIKPKMQVPIRTRCVEKVNNPLEAMMVKDICEIFLVEAHQNPRVVEKKDFGGVCRGQESVHEFLN
jgi:hypothetical protein